MRAAAQSNVSIINVDIDETLELGDAGPRLLVALLRARSGDYDGHREWMIRSYALCLAAVTLRFYLPISQIAGVPFEEAYPDATVTLRSGDQVELLHMLGRAEIDHLVDIFCQPGRTVSVLRCRRL